MPQRKNRAGEGGTGSQAGLKADEKTFLSNGAKESGSEPRRAFHLQRERDAGSKAKTAEHVWLV